MLFSFALSFLLSPMKLREFSQNAIRLSSKTSVNLNASGEIKFKSIPEGWSSCQEWTDSNLIKVKTCKLSNTCVMNHQYNLDPERGWLWPIRIESLNNGIPPAAGDERCCGHSHIFSHSYSQTQELTGKEKSLLLIVNNKVVFLEISGTIFCM